MKTIIAILALAFGLSLATKGQCGTVTLLSGCVGACGGSYSATYIVTAGDVGPTGVGVFCLSATSNSLCPSHDAVAVVQRNSNPKRTAILSDGESMRFKVLAGDVITVTVDAVFVDPNINCVWFGETHFSLMR